MKEEHRVPLESLDPGSRDDTYWPRFYRSVMAAAAGELARRRVQYELTISGVVWSWARAVVPAALVAATLAGMILLRGQDLPQPLHVDLEEVLAAGLDDGALPVMLASDVSTTPARSREGF